MRSSRRSGPDNSMRQRSRPRELVRLGAERLQAAGVEQAGSDAAWLLAQLLHTTPIELYLTESPAEPSLIERFFAKIEDRASGTPLQYLVGETAFLGQTIRVRPGVFIPRPETEAMLDHAVQALRARELTANRPLRIAEVGTGSGCIAIALAQALPTCAVVAVEVSWEALLAAQENVRRHGLIGRVALVQGRWLSPIQGGVDAIVANPPYLSSAQVDQLPIEVRQEPRVSLDGGPDGLRDLLEIMAEAPRVLLPGGLLVMECGEEQAGDLAQRALAARWVKRAVPLHDLAGRPRGVLVSA